MDILRDQRTTKMRLDAGDLSFFSKVLPKVHSDALQNLERGVAPPKVDYLGWLLRRAWEQPESLAGAQCLAAHRQVSHFVYKMELPYEPEVEDTVLKHFRETDASLAFSDDRFAEKIPSNLVADARRYLGRVIVRPSEVLGRTSTTTRLRDVLGLLPRHGPGAVSTGERGSEKWRFRRLYLSVHQRFPWYDWFVPRGAPCLLDKLTWYRGLERLPSPTAKVVLVPKDSRGPRIISEEPLEVQYLQQAYFRYMISWANHPSCRGRVNFLDQTVNQRLAKESSLTRSWATLDLKDASDRVSCALVKLLFPEEIYLDLMALRSQATQLPDGSQVVLRKFAPMGSAVCFPTLAFTVWSICVAALCWSKDLGEWDGVPHESVFVYGDDVIVPTQVVDTVQVALTLFGLKVNRGKSFAASFFRESCGVDAYYGCDITPARVRRPLGHSSQKDLTYLSYLSLVNHLRERGYERTASAVQHTLERVFGDLQYTYDPESFPGIKVDRSVPLNRRTRWSPTRSRMECLAEIPVQPQVDTRVGGWDRLLRDLLGQAGDEPSREAASRPPSIRKRWVGI